MRRQIATVVAIALLPMGAVAAPTDAGVRIDPRADAAVRRMSDYLSGLHSFRFRATSITDLVTPEGQKVQSVAEQHVAIKRPNQFRTERRDPKADVIVRDDGKTLSVYGKRTGYYATAPVPSRLGDAIDVVRERYGIEAPAADLFVENPYRELMRDVVVGRYIGVEPIDGVPCEHLAFQGKNVDWQIWIAMGPQPLPRRYAITSKHEKASPEFGVMLSDWQPAANLPDSEFVFQPPPGSQRIALRARPTAAHGSNGGAR